MALKQLLPVLSFFLIPIFISCNGGTKGLTYNRDIVEIKVYRNECEGHIPYDKFPLRKIDFNDHKESVTDICSLNSTFDKQMKDNQKFSELYYNGTIERGGLNLDLFSLVGHSGNYIGKEEGFILMASKSKLFFIKVRSTQVDKPKSLISFYNDGYILVIQTFNDSYDLPNHGKKGIYEYSILKVTRDSLTFIPADESGEVLSQKFRKELEGLK